MALRNSQRKELSNIFNGAKKGAAWGMGLIAAADLIFFGGLGMISLGLGTVVGGVVGAGAADKKNEI